MRWPTTGWVWSGHSEAMSHDALQSPVLWVIVGCEVGFWVLVIGGLAVRYLLHRRRLSTVILTLVPAVDLALLIAVAVDLSHGSGVTNVHRIAGIYLGVTVAFGHSLVSWADGRFAYWFGAAKKPARKLQSGPVALRREMVQFGQWLIAAAVAAGMTLVLSVTVADDEQAPALRGIFPMLGVITVIWLVTGPVWALFGARNDGAHDGGAGKG